MNFVYMEQAVESICKSLENEPEKWIFSAYTFHKKGSSTEYWCDGSSGDSINKIWTGRDTSVVFSYDQGKRIKKSYSIAREKQGNEDQKKVMEDLLNTSTIKKPWYKFW